MMLPVIRHGAIGSAVALVAACAFFAGGLPARGSLGGQMLETRVDTEIARYYLSSYLAGKRHDRVLDARIDGVYQNAHNGLPDRDELKRLSEEFSNDFAALYLADRIARVPANHLFRRDYEDARDRVRLALVQSRASFTDAAGDFEIVFVPGYLYQRHPATGADFAAPRATLKRVRFPHHYIETDEDGPIEANANHVLAALRARSHTGRRVIVVSASKSGAEAALALTRLGALESRHVAAWVNVVGTLQGTPLADQKLWQEMEDLIGQVDIAGVESLTTTKSRRRFGQFRIAPHVFVINYIGIPLSGSVSSLARTGYVRLRDHGPNDGLSLLPDLLYPGGLTLAELGRDHFLLEDEMDIKTLALATTVIRWLKRGWSNAAGSERGSGSPHGPLITRPLVE